MHCVVDGSGPHASLLNNRARVTVAGMICSVNKDVLAFTVDVKLDIWVCPQLKVKIRAIMKSWNTSAFAVHNYPTVGCVVTFTGKMVSIVEHALIVAVDDITFFPTPFLDKRVNHTNSHVPCPAATLSTVD